LDVQNLLRGLINFKTELAPTLRPLFQNLSHVQNPELLLIACSDSRVVPHLLTSEEPGDVFVVRSVGNIIAPAGKGGFSVGDVSEASAIEYGLEVLGIRDVAVCGHSNCGAMKAVLDGRQGLSAVAPNLVSWLEHGEAARARLTVSDFIDPALPEVDRLSQANVLQQLDHVASYTPVAKRRSEVRLHGLWFDIGTAMVSLFEPSKGRFVRLDEAEITRLLTSKEASP
jgi:carbonic anhydrase